jgi:hypothetical protein
VFELLGSLKKDCGGRDAASIEPETLEASSALSAARKTVVGEISIIGYLQSLNGMSKF